MLLKKLVLVMMPLFITTLALTQPMKKTNYTQRFNKVDSLINKKGLIQTALKEVNLIYALARQEKQEAQLIKALLYKLALQNQTQEDASQKTIEQLEKELPLFKAPARNIVNSLLADLYLAYYNNKRYELYGRSETTNYSKKDISTWSRGDFHKRIAALFNASLKETTLLQQTRLASFEPLIIKGNMRHLRPTLFDLLAHRALDYYKTGEELLDDADNRFEINSTMAFDPAADFAYRRFTTADTASLQYKALLLYQQLIRFHLSDKTPDALIDVDLQRYEFVHSHATTEDKDEAYELNIKHIAHQYNQTPAAAQAWYLLARMHADKADTYEPLKNDTSTGNPQFEYVKALEICNRVLQQKQNSEGKVNCQNLSNEILTRTISLETEKVNSPGVPFRTLVTYKNIPTLYLRLIKATKEITDKTGEGESEELWKYIAGLKPFSSWQQPLPTTNDYQTHRTEIKIDALPAGSYFLLTSADENFSTSNNPLALQY
ncbi:MAG: alpha-2-macroglobulin, partial [Flavihumibacter sp.]|nr:alpha-2-macroglobulin [Flavihumibacter sp.]